MPTMSALVSGDACVWLARNGTARSSAAHATDAAMNAARQVDAAESRRAMRTPNGTLSRHDRSFTPASGRRRARVRHAADDRARAHAHLLGRDVLPLRVPGDLDRAVRRQRQRRLRVRDAPAPGPVFDRRPAGYPVADLRGLHDRRAVLARPAARRPALLAAPPGADADDLLARRA